MIGTDAGVIVCYNEENDTSFRIPPQVGHTVVNFCFSCILDFYNAHFYYLYYVIYIVYLFVFDFIIQIY